MDRARDHRPVLLPRGVISDVIPAKAAIHGGCFQLHFSAESITTSWNSSGNLGIHKPGGPARGRNPSKTSLSCGVFMVGVQRLPDLFPMLRAFAGMTATALAEMIGAGP